LTNSSYKVLEARTFLWDNPPVSATIIDKKHRMTLPESICAAVGLKPNDQVEWRVEDGEIRGRKLVPQRRKEAFPRGSLLKYLIPARDKEQLAILSGCVQGPDKSE
jgi:bifunctional DNA-binding transcriptional regulator/antitoxin component of YhaV-PrlF toxin-antitoxin module